MTEHIAKAILPTGFGVFDLHTFNDGRDSHDVLVKPWIKEPVLLRIQSSCRTGETHGSLRCDCREQWIISRAIIGENEGIGEGMGIYLMQEGRGIGHDNKMRAYELIDQGYDTYAANLKLGFKEDERDYRIAVEILEYFNVSSVLLLTSNSEKINTLKKAGLKVETIPLEIAANQYNLDYIKAKNERMGMPPPRLGETPESQLTEMRESYRQKIRELKHRIREIKRQRKDVQGCAAGFTG